MHNCTDILTPLPALGVDFSIVEGKGPRFERPLRTTEDIKNVGKMVDVDAQLPFLSPILKVQQTLVFCMMKFTGLC
jgi:uroporphyrinogen decarboxylase